VAQRLQQLGIKHVRPLAGGFQKWKALGFPLVEAQEVAWPGVTRITNPIASA